MKNLGKKKKNILINLVMTYEVNEFFVDPTLIKNFLRLNLKARSNDSGQCGARVFMAASFFMCKSP